MSANRKRGPRVADFSTHFSGPVASWHLGQLGGDVIKIEHPRFGDGNRGLPPFVDQEGISHLHLNVGTRSFALEPGTALWARSVIALTKWADVVIVGNRPGSALKLGLDFHSLLRHNPRLIYCLISGYGVSGEWATLPAHGLNMDALAGTIPIEWTAGVPRIPSHYRSVGTTLAGVQAALGIYAALFRRDQGGGGQIVQISIWEAALSSMWRDIGTFANTGDAWTSYEDMGARYAAYGTRDGKTILCCPIERKFWERFCDVLELSPDVKARGDWSTGTDMGSAYEALGERALIQSRIATRSRAEWLDVMGRADLPVAPVLDWREAMTSAHGESNGTMAEYQHRDKAIRVATTPISITAGALLNADDYSELAARHREKSAGAAGPPALGEHTNEIIEELGIKP